MVDLAGGREAVEVRLGESVSQELTRRLAASFREYLPTCKLHESYLASRLNETVKLRHEAERGTDDEYDEAGCSCEPDEAGQACSATSESCDCVGTYGNFYVDQPASPTLLLDAIPARHALVECSDECACSTKGCANRVVGRGLRAALTVVDAGPSMGLGLQTTHSISKGHFVIEYAGEIVSDHEARQRWEAYAMDENVVGNYILAVKEHSEGHILRTNIDPTRVGNAARFINHSCDANLVMLPVRVDGSIQLTSQSEQVRAPSPPRAALFAKRDIAAGEQLSFDYSDGSSSSGESGGGQSTTGREEQAVGATMARCLCMAATCRGWLYTDASL
ncbi:SET domain-containing protein [Acaromyces ingoldii]|uniref:SET domain-containing protein n=1 Tax=Acaromyces ingoldii TaxID=215250 RepID=A0A316YFP3_9BASI|nr:SET domain-containing protein [Acaromyces ingoldii]PWN87896.1 SET domain-containing protein [Acaromyces ingoldii]